jgi:hypothetical protein
VTVIPARSRITGANRKAIRGELVKKYKSGATIRGLAAEYGRSYGFMHRMLSESGIALRGRGGNVRKVAQVQVQAGAR